MTTENDIMFDESKFKIRSRAILGEPEVPTMIKVLVKSGIVKTENQAVGVLLGIMGLFFLLSIYIYMTFVLDINIFSKKVKLTPEQIQVNKERIKELREKNQKAIETEVENSN